MKRHTTTAALLASTMMLALVGCDGTSMSATEGSSEMEMTEEAKREIAKAEMVAGEDASSNASSAEAATAASSETSAATAASSEVSDAATTASSADKSETKTDAAATATSQQPQTKLAENEIIYNGKVLSVLDDSAKTLADLGTYEDKKTYSLNEYNYSYDSGNIHYSTYLSEGKELPLSLSVYNRKDIKTSRNAGVGDTVDQITSLYGKPVEKGYFEGGTGTEYSYKYKFDKFSLYFCFSEKTDKVAWFAFDHNANVDKSNKEALANEKANTAAANTSTTPAAPEENKATASSNTANKGDVKDYQFTYNGNVVSIMDSFDAVNKAMGGYVPADSNIQSLQSYYAYGKNQAVGMICRSDFGTETPITISTRVAGMTTARNIKVGSSKDDLIAAYGTPNGKHNQVFDGPTGKELTEEEYIAIFGESFVYELGDVRISFSVENGKVASIEYQNNVNYKKFQWS